MMNALMPEAQFAKWLIRAQHAIVFTGAGISTESGIPDFRSPGGIWSRMQPIDFREYLRSPGARQESWRRIFSDAFGLADKRPNLGHNIVANWVRLGWVAYVITQNVDNFHQLAGVADEQIIELHGNAGHARCLDCGRRHELEVLRADFQKNGAVRACETCGGLLKLAVISFGQPMPEEAMTNAERASETSDLFIVIGSSLQVYPAAGLPQIAREKGARLVILNREPTELDGIADLVIHAEIGQTLAAVHAMLR